VPTPPEVPAGPAGEPRDDRIAASLSPQELVGLLEVFLLGSEPTMTGPDVAARAGITYERAREEWQSLGFTHVPEDEVAFTEADLQATRLVEKLREFGIADEESEAALVRTVGRTFARLAEWQLDLLARMIDLEKVSVSDLADVMAVLRPMAEELSLYVWRRHTLSAASRLLLAPQSEEGEGVLGVGFADIVDYTRQSRSLRQDEIARLTDAFEGTALEIVTAHQGRIIKSIGDEILFVADRPEDVAAIALELVERHILDEDFPELRAGAAYGPVLSRLGDVFGPVVNLAARLTSSSRPGRVLVDRGLADALEGDETYRLRRMRRTSVKGYRRLEPWLLRRPVGEDPEFDSEHLPGPASQFLAERGRDLMRVVEERQAGDEPGAGDAEPEE